MRSDRRPCAQGRGERSPSRTPNRPIQTRPPDSEAGEEPDPPQICGGPSNPWCRRYIVITPPPLPLCGNNSRNPLRQLRAFLVRVWDGSICNPTHSPPADPPSRTSHRAPRLGGRRSVRRSQRCRAPSFRSGPHRLHLGAPTSGLKRVDEKKR